VTLLDPRFATDDTYTSGTDNGLPTKVAPSTGRRAQGFTRDAPLPVPVVNSILYTHGEHLAAIVDQHAFQWTPQPAYANANLAPNDNISTDPPLIYAAGQQWLVKTPDGGTGVAFHRRKHGQGLALASSSDTDLFTASANSGAGADAAILTDRSLTKVVEISNAGTVRQSDDWGATWAGAGTVTLESQCGGFFNGAWHAVHTELDGSHLVSSDSDLSGAWTITDVDPANTVDATSYRRFVRSSTVALFLPASCTTLTQLLINSGSGWGVQTITGAGASSTWRGDYNASLGLFMLTNLAGQCWISADGVAWSLFYTHSTAIYDVAATGRGWILSCVTEDFSGPATYPHLAYIHYPQATPAARRLPWESPATDYSRYHLLRVRGRVIAARVTDSAGRLEWWESGFHSLDVDANGF
jgi:hypothetical protein